jgi:hypothetical protein
MKPAIPRGLKCGKQLPYILAYSFPKSVSERSLLNSADCPSAASPVEAENQE